MDVGNLARVFGPTIVGHSVPNPDPMTILQDTKRQPKVSLTRPLRRLESCRRRTRALTLLASLLVSVITPIISSCLAFRS